MEKFGDPVTGITGKLSVWVTKAYTQHRLAKAVHIPLFPHKWTNAYRARTNKSKIM